MSILKGIKLKDDATVHQLDYENGVANKPKIITSYNDLEGKPFYSSGIALTYNADYESYENVSATFDNTTVYFVKVSNESISYDDVLNGTVTIVEQGEEMPMAIDEALILQNESGLIIADSINIITVDSYEIDGATLTRGVWFAHMFVDNVSMMYVKSLNCETVKKLDSKYVDAYTTEEIDAMFGNYVDEVDTLLGGSK